MNQMQSGPTDLTINDMQRRFTLRQLHKPIPLESEVSHLFTGGLQLSISPLFLAKIASTVIQTEWRKFSHERRNAREIASTVIQAEWRNFRHEKARVREEMITGLAVSMQALTRGVLVRNRLLENKPESEDQSLLENKAASEDQPSLGLSVVG